MSEWISVKKCLPINHKPVLIFYHTTDKKDTETVSVGCRLIKNRKIKWEHHNLFGSSILCIENIKSYFTLTHWMPFPDGPTENKE